MDPKSTPHPTHPPTSVGLTLLRLQLCTVWKSNIRGNSVSSEVDYVTRCFLPQIPEAHNSRLSFVAAASSRLVVVVVVVHTANRWHGEEPAAWVAPPIPDRSTTRHRISINAGTKFWFRSCREWIFYFDHAGSEFWFRSCRDWIFILIMPGVNFDFDHAGTGFWFR
jgi:hypothetical protein